MDPSTSDGLPPGTPVLEISRPVLNQEVFDEIYGSQYVDLSTCGRLKWYAAKWRSQPCKRIHKALLTMLPCLFWLKNYKMRSELLPDVLSGFTVGIMNIPQGMAYGILALLPPQFGLYTSFFPPLIYAFLGTSRHISFGTFAVISLMVRTVIEKNVPPIGPLPIPNSTNNTPGLPKFPGSAANSSFFDFCDLDRTTPGSGDGRNINDVLEVAFCLTFLVGVFQVILGFVQAGFVSVYLSDQLVVGLTTGAAVQVLTSQFGHLFGIRGLPSTTGSFALIKFYTCLFFNIAKANAITTLMSLISILSMVVIKYWLEPKVKRRFKFPIPTELIVVIVMTATCYGFDLNNNEKVSIVGHIPTGLPNPKLPNFKYASNIIADAIIIAVVVFSISVSMAKLFAKKHDYAIHANQEWYAYGIVHIISSFFSCHCAGSSLSRSALQESQGGNSQLASIFSCAVILLVLLFLAPLFKHTPQFIHPALLNVYFGFFVVLYKCALAAIIVVNLKTMIFQINQLPSLWRKSKIDFLIWIVTFTSVVLFDVSYGLIIGVVFAMMTVLFRSQWPDSICLGNVPGTEIYKGINAYGNVVELPGIKIYRFESPLYFANAALFKEQLYHKTKCDPVEVRSQRLKVACRLETDSLQRPMISKSNIDLDTTHEGRVSNRADLSSDAKDEIDSLFAVIIDCSSFPYMDLSGVEILRQVYEEYSKIGVRVIFCSVKVAVRQLFQTCNFYESVPKSCLYLTVHDAVLALQSCSNLGETLRNFPTVLAS